MTSIPVSALVWVIVLCSWARHFTLTLPLSTQEYKWVRATKCWGVTCDELASHPGGVAFTPSWLHAKETGISSGSVGQFGLSAALPSETSRGMNKRQQIKRECESYHYRTFWNENTLQSCFEVRQYLRYTNNTLSPVNEVREVGRGQINDHHQHFLVLTTDFRYGIDSI